MTGEEEVAGKESSAMQDKAALEAIFESVWKDTLGLQGEALKGVPSRLQESLAPDAGSGHNRVEPTRNLFDHLPDREKQKLQEVVWRRVFAGLLARLPKDYRERATSMKAMTHSFRSELAASLQPSINTYLHALPYETYAEKQAIATWVNEELRELGLAVRCPKTGKPANLIADVQGGENSASRFRLDARNDDGTRMRTISSRGLFDLELMEDVAREEPLSRKARNSRG